MPETTATRDNTLDILPVPHERRIDPDEGKHWLCERLNEYLLLLGYGVRVAPGPADVAWSILRMDIQTYTQAAVEAALEGVPVRVERESEQNVSAAEAARYLRSLLEDYSCLYAAEGVDYPGANRAYVELCREYNRRCPDACWPVPDSGPVDMHA